MAKATKNKSAKEASTTFHNIMAASVKDNKLKNKKMTVYIFECANTNIHGYTNLKDEKNLPNNICKKWNFLKQMDIDENSNLIGVSAKNIIDGINKDEYYISTHKISFSEKIEKK